MSRLRSTSLIFGDQAFDRDRKREASTALRLAGGGTVTVPGCLTSESEERETWTAESLRAALLRKREGRPSTEGLHPSAYKEKWPEETSAVLRFRSYTVFVQAACGARARMKKVTDLVNVRCRCTSTYKCSGARALLRAKRCDQPGKVLIQT